MDLKIRKQHESEKQEPIKENDLYTDDAAQKKKRQNPLPVMSSQLRRHEYETQTASSPTS
jgi:hypothetical protein